jgi:hypothetical protein
VLTPFSYLQTYSFKGSLIPQVSEFQPIPAIHRGDADVSLVFLSAGNIIFTKPVDDPWYSAHVPLQNITATGNSKGRQELYMADSPASVLGCAIQYQQCISTLPEGKRCSQLGGLWETNQTISTETEWQFGMLQWIGTTFAESEVQYLVASLRAGSLTSKYSNIASLQGPLPENQWQLDVEQWHYATLAAAQASAIDYATGPGINESISQVWETPEDDDDVGKYFCRNQVSLSLLAFPVRSSSISARNNCCKSSRDVRCTVGTTRVALRAHLMLLAHPQHCCGTPPTVNELCCSPYRH